MGTMRYKPSDKVRIKSLDWYNENKDKNGNIVFSSKVPHFALCVNVRTVFTKDMVKYCGKVVTIENVWTANYSIVEGTHRDYFTDEMIEGLVEEEKKPEFKVGDEVIAYAEGCLAKFSINDVRWNNELNKFEYKICSSWYDASVMQLYKESNNFLTERVSDNGLPFNEWLSYKGAFYVPDGYELKDENGNVINATKIVLEKKKKEYPKTYEECLKIMGVKLSDCYIQGYKSPLLEDLQELLICRDAYWKLAGEEMGLGKPWEPSDSDYITGRYCIFVHQGNIICSTPAEDCPFTFPTEEMRDAFYENFKELIESVKELL